MLFKTLVVKRNNHSDRVIGVSYVDVTFIPLFDVLVLSENRLRLIFDR